MDVAKKYLIFVNENGQDQPLQEPLRSEMMVFLRWLIIELRSDTPSDLFLEIAPSLPLTWH